MLQPDASAIDALRALYKDIEARLIVTEDYVALLALDHALEGIEPVLAPALSDFAAVQSHSGEDVSALALVSPAHAEPVRRDARFWQETIGRLRMKRSTELS